MGLINNGIRQWIFQRITNALIVSFGVVLVYIFLTQDIANYKSLVTLVTLSGLSYYFAIVLILSCLNAILAGWQIDGDYAKKFGLPKNLLTVIAAVVSLVYLFVGLKLLFG